MTDNDNNLLLAGAGTGKTRVVVGKAGYLVNICH
ncbi:UvrD-helicase domain-containing protein [Vibrio splendidus]